VRPRAARWRAAALCAAALACRDAGPESPPRTAPEPTAAMDSDDTHLARARAILRRVPLVDGHNDLPWQYRKRGLTLEGLDLTRDLSHLEPVLHTDLPRLRRGGVGAQFWSVYVEAEGPAASWLPNTLEQIDLVYRMVRRYPRDLEMAYTAADIERIHSAGRIASLIGVEGGHSIAGSLAVLRQLYRLGARYLTLTHSLNTPWADSATDKAQHGGLTDFGRDLVREMNRLGMLVDLSHVSPETMHDALDTTVAPVVFTHSCARALADHARNVPDEVLQRLPANGGVVMVTFVPPFVSKEVLAVELVERDRLKALYPNQPDKLSAEMEAWRRAHPDLPRATLAQVADHLDHVRQVAGPDHVGIGSDFDGITSVPVGLEDVSRYPDLLAELLRRGWSEEEVEKAAGRNLLRVLRAAEKAAAAPEVAPPPE
jgi:membrane dipeptidase